MEFFLRYPILVSVFFFFTDTATTEIYTLSLHDALPIFGYDTALLLLEALRESPRTSAQVRRALEALRDIEGATGVFSVVDGRVIRRTEVVYIDNGILARIN